TLAVRDVVETRVLLETWATRVAGARVARGAGGDDDGEGYDGGGEGSGEEGAADGGVAGVLAQARALLARVDDPALLATAFRALDATFAVLVARLAGNGLGEAILAGLRGAIESYVARGCAALPSGERTAARRRAEPRAVLDAVAAGDGERAATAVRAHIEGFYAETGL